MATHSRILACKRQRSLESMGSQRVRHDWVSEYAHTPHYSMYQCWVLSYVRILFLLLLHLPVDGHLGCFHILAVSNKTAMNINICIYGDIISTSLGYLSLNAFMLFLPEGSVKQGLNNTPAVITFTCKKARSECWQEMLPAVWYHSWTWKFGGFFFYCPIFRDSMLQGHSLR